MPFSAVFEGRAADATPVALMLTAVERRANGILWLRYDVERAQQNPLR